MAEDSGEAGPQDLALLRDKAVDQLIEEGTVTSEAVEAAMRTVPRHLFIPEASPEEAYDPFCAFVTKRDGDGNAISSVSDMHVQSWMLEHAGIQPGMNVLEVGSGGYNAALLAELVGPGGNVTTVDIDEWVTDRTSRFLGQAGYERVSVVLADAEHGVPEHAAYDAVLVTVGCWDVPPRRGHRAAPGVAVPVRAAPLGRLSRAVPGPVRDIRASDDPSPPAFPSVIQ